MNIFVIEDDRGSLSLHVANINQEEMKKSLDQEGTGEKVVNFLPQTSALAEVLNTLISVNGEQEGSLLQQFEKMLKEVHFAGFDKGYDWGYESGERADFPIDQEEG
jgi:hypothetical protein